MPLTATHEQTAEVLGWGWGGLNTGQSGPVHLQTTAATYTLTHTLRPTVKRSLPHTQTQKTPDYLVGLFTPLSDPGMSPGPSLWQHKEPFQSEKAVEC